MAELMASVIVMSEEARDAAPDANGHSNGLKRRQPEAGDQEQESKRQRKIPGKSLPAAPAPDAPREEAKEKPETSATTKEQHGGMRKKRGVADEKQRSKRLFGAVLGNLNRPRDRNATKRAEIEQRRKAELKKQDDKRLEDKQKRLEQLATHRMKEQIKVDEHNMHIRHKNMLSNANFLQIQAEPKLYYKPWELLPDEEDRIEDQIRDTEKQIDKELADWAIEKRRRLHEIDRRTDDDEMRVPPERYGEAEREDHQQANRSTSGDTGFQHQIATADTENLIKPAEMPESDPDPNGSSQVQEPSEPEKVVSSDVADAVTDPTSTRQQESIDEPKKELEEKVSKEEHDDDGDHIVEGDEDTVIY